MTTIPTAIITTILTTAITIIPTNIKTEIQTTIMDNKCRYETVVDKTCVFLNMTHKDIITKIKDEVLHTYPPDGINIVIYDDTDYAVQLTSSFNEIQTLDGALINLNGMSIINLKECESLLKQIYNIDSTDPLIFLKLEKKTILASDKNVQYEVYHPRTFEKLDLSICSKSDIDVVIPIKLDEDTEKLYKSLKDEGYDLFNRDDKFYHDICTPYETGNGADILLDDRIIHLYSKIVNITTCPDQCFYTHFYFEIKGLSCQCKASNEDIDMDNIDKNKGHSYFVPELNGLKYSGYKSMKCYNLVFSYKHFKSNIGSIINLVFLGAYIGFMIYYIIKDISPLRLELSKLLFNEKEVKDNEVKVDTMNPLITYNSRNQAISKRNNESKSVKSSLMFKSKRGAKSMKGSSKKNLYFPPRKALDIERINSAEKKKDNKNIKLLDLMKNKKKIGKLKLFHNIKNKKKVKIDDGLPKKDFDVESMKSDRVRKRKSIIDYQKEREIRIQRARALILANNNLMLHRELNEEKSKETKSEFKKSFQPQKREMEIEFDLNKGKEEKTLDDYELNHLEYENAIDLDNRGFLKVYWSIIKRDELFLFTFVSCKDYNLFYIKIEKFFFVIMTIMALNGFLYSDKTVHNLYLNGVKYNFNQHLLPISLSIVIAHIMEILACYLTLTDRYIYEIKAIPKFEGNGKTAFSILRRMRIKLMEFYLGAFALSAFYWYFISAFCSVYPNTQGIYIINCLISFVIFLIDPFIIYAFTTMLRIISLKSVVNKKLKWLYKISRFFPIF